MGILDTVLKGLNPEAIADLLRQQVEAQNMIAANTVAIASRLDAIDAKQDMILGLLGTMAAAMRGQRDDLASLRGTNSQLAERLAIAGPVGQPLRNGESVDPV